MLFSRLSTFHSALDASAMRQKTIANNLANAETPNFRSQRVVFEEELKKAMTPSKLQAFQTHPKHVAFMNQPQAFPRIVENHGLMNNHGNNVDVDYEMAEMAKNQIRYDALVQRTNGFFNSLQTVIKGR